MLLATKHILTDKSSFPSKRHPGVAGRAGSPPGISEHRKQSPQTICKPFEAEDRGVTSCSGRGKATFSVHAVQNPSGEAPGAVRATGITGHHRITAAPQQGGLGLLPGTGGLLQCASGHGSVCGRIHPLLEARGGNRF